MAIGNYSRDLVGSRLDDLVPTWPRAVAPVARRPVDGRGQVFVGLAGAVEVAVDGQLAVERLRRVVGQADLLAAVGPAHRGRVGRHVVALLFAVLHMHH